MLRCGAFVALALPAVALTACAGASAPARRDASSRKDASPAAASSQQLAARWIDSAGVTLVGPKVAGGTLVLLGGRRAVVTNSGTMCPESYRSPEPLLEIIEVP